LEIYSEVRHASLGRATLLDIAMGYRMRRPNSLAGYSPYFLLFGRWPIIGTAIRKVYSKVVDLDNPQTWARVVEERARILRRRCQSH
jgi:hypothetical protein